MLDNFSLGKRKKINEFWESYHKKGDWCLLLCRFFIVGTIGISNRLVYEYLEGMLVLVKVYISGNLCHQ